MERSPGQGTDIAARKHMLDVRGFRVHFRELITSLALLGGVPVAPAQSLTEALAAETARNRTALQAIPASELVESERPRLKGLLDDSESLLKAGRVGLALESVASAAPGIVAVARAGSGWDDTGKGSGKHIDALTREW